MGEGDIGKKAVDYNRENHNSLPTDTSKLLTCRTRRQGPSCKELLKRWQSALSSRPRYLLYTLEYVQGKLHELIWQGRARCKEGRTRKSTNPKRERETTRAKGFQQNAESSSQQGCESWNFTCGRKARPKEKAARRHRKRRWTNKRGGGRVHRRQPYKPQA